MQLVLPLTFQGYELYCDNYYSSPVLFDYLRQHGVLATCTFHSNRRGLPSEVVSLKDALLKVPWRIGYYIRDSEIDIVYCKVPTWYPGIALVQMVNEQQWKFQGPIAIEKYNQFTGGVDKSVQYLAYHNV